MFVVIGELLQHGKAGFLFGREERP
jgi:hypothetical protein